MLLLFFVCCCCCCHSCCSWWWYHNDMSELLLTISPSSGVRHQHRGLAERAAPQGARGDRQRRDLLRVGGRAMPAHDAVAGERHRKLRKKYVLSHISFYRSGLATLATAPHSTFTTSASLPLGATTPSAPLRSSREFPSAAGATRQVPGANRSGHKKGKTIKICTLLPAFFESSMRILPYS